MQPINSNNNVYGILLRNMQINSRLSATATERLSTGKRINHASDSPSDMLRISRLNSKIRGTEVAGRNIQDGISLIQTTENSLNQIQNMGQRLKELSVSYNNGTLNDDDKKVIENESKELLKEIQNIQEKTDFNGQKVFSKDKYTIQTGSEANDTYDVKIKGIDISKLGVASTNTSLNTNNVENTTSLNNGSLTTTLSSIKSTGSTSTGATTKGTTSIGTSNPDTITSAQKTSVSTQIANTGSTSTSTGSTTTTTTTTTSTSSTSTTTNQTSNPLMTAVNVTNTNGYVEWKNSSGNLIYVGNVTNGKCDGYGTLYDGTGSKVYQGNFTSGAYNGFGTIYSGGKVAYVGTTANGIYNGFGTTYDSSGNTAYAGDFKDGKYDGYGTEKLSNGYIYSGYYKEGLRNGYGTLSNQSWCPLYAGNWANDKPSDGRTISGYTPKTASDVKVVVNTPPAIIIPSTSTGGGTTPTPGTGTGGDTGTGTTPSTGGSGSTTPPSTGTGTTSPSTGGTTTPTDGSSGTTPSGGGSTTPTDNTGNTGGTGTTPSTGNGGSNTTPPTNSTGGTDNSNVINILKDDNIDKYILKPVRDAISSLGVQEEILSSRYDLSVNQNQINEDYLSKIEDVDMAKEMLKKARADMLLQVNLSLFSNKLSDDRDYIAMLLR